MSLRAHSHRFRPKTPDGARHVHRILVTSQFRVGYALIGLYFVLVVFLSLIWGIGSTELKPMAGPGMTTCTLAVVPTFSCILSLVPWVMITFAIWVTLYFVVTAFRLFVLWRDPMRVFSEPKTPEDKVYLGVTVAYSVFALLKVVFMGLILAVPIANVDGTQRPDNETLHTVFVGLFGGFHVLDSLLMVVRRSFLDNRAEGTDTRRHMVWLNWFYVTAESGLGLVFLLVAAGAIAAGTVETGSFEVAFTLIVGIGDMFIAAFLDYFWDKAKLQFGAYKMEGDA